MTWRRGRGRGRVKQRLVERERAEWGVKGGEGGLCGRDRCIEGSVDQEGGGRRNENS